MFFVILSLGSNLPPLRTAELTCLCCSLTTVELSDEAATARAVVADVLLSVVKQPCTVVGAVVGLCLHL